MIESLLIPIMLISAALYVLLNTAYFIGGNIYDVRMIKAGIIENNIKRKNHKPKALITVLVESNNNQASIKQCLDSLIQNSYKQIAIIIIDHASSDKTLEIIRGYIKAHPKASIKLIARHERSSQDKAVYSSYRRYAKGSLIARLNGDTVIDKQALTKASQYFSTYNVDVIIPKVETTKIESLTSLLQNYLNLSAIRTQKFNSLIKLPVNSSQTIYKKEYFKQLVNQPKIIDTKSLVLEDVIFYIKPTQSLLSLIHKSARASLIRLKAHFRQSQFWPLALVFLIIQLFVPLLISYLLYLAFRLHEPTLLALSCLLLGLFLLMTLLSNSTSSIKQKIVNSLLIPITFIPFYIISLAQMVATLQPILWPDFLSSEALRQKHT